MLAVVAAVTFGVLWVTANADARNAEREVAEAQEQLSDVEDELTEAMASSVDLERDAMYTACTKFHVGFLVGKGEDVDATMGWVMDSCATESAWEDFPMDNAPER